MHRCLACLLCLGLLGRMVPGPHHVQLHACSLPSDSLSQKDAVCFLLACSLILPGLEATPDQLAITRHLRPGLCKSCLAQKFSLAQEALVALLLGCGLPSSKGRLEHRGNCGLGGRQGCCLAGPGA